MSMLDKAIRHEAWLIMVEHQEPHVQPGDGWRYSCLLCVTFSPTATGLRGRGTLPPGRSVPGSGNWQRFHEAIFRKLGFGNLHSEPGFQAPYLKKLGSAGLVWFPGLGERWSISHHGTPHRASGDMGAASAFKHVRMSLPDAFCSPGARLSQIML